MKMTIEITQKKDLKINGKNGYYLIKQEKDIFYIYKKYNDDDNLYYIESMKTIVDALIRIYNGYIEI